MKINISFGGNIKHDDILLFTRHLSVTMKSGLTLFEGIDMLYDQTTGNMQKMLGEIKDQLREGKQFHEILQLYPKYFSPLYVSLIKIGELSGTLDANLKHLVEELRKAHELKQKVKSAMMYPMLIFIGVVGLAFSVALFVLPKILPLFKTLNVELPLTTRVLIFVADLFSSHGILVTSATAALVVFLHWFLHRKFIKPILHRFYLKIPVIKKMVQYVNLERFARTLGTLLTSGIPVNQSLQICADATGNEIYKNAILSFVPQMEKGNSLGTNLDRYPQLFPKMVSRMIGMGEQTGNLDTTLHYLSEYYGEEIDSTMKNLATIIEPALLIFIGAVVGVVALSILGPIYKITGNIKQS